ncbi:hypothetical protein F443_01385, partial [Phytophthora nicotianae P1569]
FHLSRPKANPTTKPDRIIGWAHPELRQLLMYNGVSLFFDCTFRCVPTGFKQCMLMMVYDQEKLEPCDVVCAFEMLRIQAIEKQFPIAEVIGCLFHFKQAERRQMKTTYSIPDAEDRVAVEKGVLDLLTVIEPNLVPRHGIRW